MITLRDFENVDSALLLVYLNDKEVTRYITDAIPKPYTEKDVQWWLSAGCKADYSKAIEFNGIFVGCISATKGSVEYSRSAELGYWIGCEYEYCWRFSIH